MARSAVHPRLLARLGGTGLFPQIATIQTFDESAQSATGAIQRGHWTDVFGLENLPARKGPMSGSKARVGEMRKEYGVIEHELYEVALQGYFPQITTSMRCSLTDGHIYDIMDIDYDSTSTWTILYVALVKPTAEPGT
jgi:hypothetical protein